MKKEGNKKMPTPRHKLIHNPIPTSLFWILFVCCECIRQRKSIFTLNWLHEIHCGLERNKDVGMGLWMSLCLGVGIFLFPFFFMPLTSLHSPSFHRNDFSTCSTHFSFILVQSPEVFSLRRAHVDFMHAHAHAENLHVHTCTYTRK